MRRVVSTFENSYREESSEVVSESSYRRQVAEAVAEAVSELVHAVQIIARVGHDGANPICANTTCAK